MGDTRVLSNESVMSQAATSTHGIRRYKPSPLKVPHPRSIEAQPHALTLKKTPHFASDDQLLGTGASSPLLCEDVRCLV